MKKIVLLICAVLLGVISAWSVSKNVNQPSGLFQNREIVTISADNSTVVENGNIGAQWMHEPLKTIINLKDKEVRIQDVVTREFRSFKILDFASRDAGEVGILTDGCFLSIDIIGKDMRLKFNENSCIVQTNITIE